MFPCLALLLSCGNKIMLVGYARVSTADQNPQLQLDALIAAGCGKVFVEKASGAKINRAELTAALEYMRPGDITQRVDRSASSCAGQAVLAVPPNVLVWYYPACHSPRTQPK